MVLSHGHDCFTERKLKVLRILKDQNAYRAMQTKVSLLIHVCHSSQGLGMIAYWFRIDWLPGAKKIPKVLHLGCPSSLGTTLATPLL